MLQTVDFHEFNRMAAGSQISRIAPDNQYYRNIATDADLLEFVYRTWGVRIPDTQVCEHHSTPARAFCEAFFARSPVSIWEASRGLGGKSMLLSLLAATEAVALGASVNLLGGSGEQSKRVLDYMANFWAYESAPRQLLESAPSATRAHLTNGGKLQALMASQASVRGPHPQRLRLDEIDEMKLSILDASLGQPMDTPTVPSQVVMSSTHQYLDGTMTEMKKRAAEQGFTIHTWCYRENLHPHGWLTQAMVEKAKARVTAAMWESEFELQEPSPDSRAIDGEAVAKMFDKELGEYAGDPHQYIEIEAPQEDAEYSTGADWARKRDWTEIITWRIDVYPKKLVAYERTGRLAWPVMVEKYNKRVNRFPGKAFHDGTGIGDVVNDYLTVEAEGVIMVGRTRADMLTNYIAEIERGGFISPFIRWLEAEHRLASVDDVYAGGDGHLPDGIAAGSLGYMGCDDSASKDPQAFPFNPFFGRRR